MLSRQAVTTLCWPVRSRLEVGGTLMLAAPACQFRAQSVWSSVLEPAEFFFSDSMPFKALAFLSYASPVTMTYPCSL